MLGGYITWSFGKHGVHPLLGVPVACVVLWGVGWVLYRTVISKVITRDLFTSLLATFGIAIVIQQGLNLAFGPDTQSAQARPADLGFRRRADHRHRDPRSSALSCRCCWRSAVILFMKNSRMGQAIRATAQDARAARVLGIDTEKVYSFTFCLNAAICGAAGALVAVVWNVQPFMGTTYSIRLFVVVTAAGFGNLPGVIAAGFGMGVFEQFGGFVLGAQYQQALIVLLLLIVLAVRQIAEPSGASGRAMSSRSLQPLHILAAAARRRRGAAAVSELHQPDRRALADDRVRLTWDILGGQMGYNSLGNIFFFGAGMYVSAVVQIGLFYDVGMYTASSRTTAHRVQPRAVFHRLRARHRWRQASHPRCLRSGSAGSCSDCAVPISPSARSASRLPAAELTAAWDWVGAASGISLPVFPGEPGARSCSSTSCCSAWRLPCSLFLRWLYSTNFGLAINAIRDDEEKAEAMGLHTAPLQARRRWSISAFFLGIAGAIFGNMTGFIEPRDIAFPTTTFNIFMVLMVLLGGKGTLWGPVRRRGGLPRHQGGDLDLLPRLAVRRARPAHRRHRRLLPAGHRRLADGEDIPSASASMSRPKRRGAARQTAARAASGRPRNERRRSSRSRTSASRSAAWSPTATSRSSVPRGGITGLIGPNGSGKTTLFNSIVGYHPIDSGSIRFEGQEISRLRVQEIARLGLLRTFQTDAHLRQDELPAEHADLDPASQSGAFSTCSRSEAREDVGARRSPAGLRRPLREALPARRHPVLRPAEAAGIRHGADERADRAAARRADRRHQPDADQRPDRPAEARQHRVRHHAVRHRAQHAGDHEHGAA